MRLSFKVPCDVSAPAQTRRQLATLSESLSEEALEDIQILTNELVTNCVLHARSTGPIEVSVRVSHGHQARVEVMDPATTSLPRMRTARLDDTSGRGLSMVDALSDRWGVRVGAVKAVWFELDLGRQNA